MIEMGIGKRFTCLCSINSLLPKTFYLIYFIIRWELLGV